MSAAKRADTFGAIEAIVKRQKALYGSLTPEQRTMVDEAREYAANYAAMFVERTREMDEMRRRLRDFAATWHLASGHEYSLDDCRWSTCLDLLTGSITTGEQLQARTAGLPVSA